VLRSTGFAGPGSENPALIDEIRAWEQKRDHYTKAITKILGEPSSLTIPAAEVQALGEEVFDDHVRRHIRIRSEVDDWIPAYLLLPKNMPATPLPAMICIHQTVAQGKDEPCGIKGDKGTCSPWLVRRGYVYRPDMIGFGERIPAGTQPYRQRCLLQASQIIVFHGKWSGMSRESSTICGRAVVDPLQIGSIGHSSSYDTLRRRVGAALRRHRRLRLHDFPQRPAAQSLVAPGLPSFRNGACLPTCRRLRSTGAMSAR
jgi:hypothetical protein